MNDWVYNLINNGVYKAGFASSQAAYEENVKALFEALERVEKILSDGRKYLLGDTFTEAGM
jgi:putative glutathione S-transferase